MIGFTFMNDQVKVRTDENDKTCRIRISSPRLGVSVLATLSTGEVIDGPKAHKMFLKRLKRLSRSMSRKQKALAN